MNTGFRFKELNINHGLSQNFASSICQDDPGFIWIGTKDGLNMYDGYSFTIFRHDPFDPHSLSDNYIQSIFCDSEGRIWIGTFNGGLNLYDRERNRFIRFLHDAENPQSISTNNIKSIVDDAEGNIWIGTSQGGINRISIPSGQLIPEYNDMLITRFDITVGDYPLNKETISSLSRDHYNTIWIGTGRRVISLTTGPLPVFNEVLVHTSNRNSAHSIMQDGTFEGRILVFEDHHFATWMLNRLGLFRYDRPSGVFRQQPDAVLHDFRKGFTYDPLAAVAFLNKGINELWLSTEGGLVVFYPETNRLVRLQHGEERPDGLPNEQIISLFADKSGTMWMGSSGYGMSVYDPYTMKFIYPYDAGNSLSGTPISSRDLSIWSIYESGGNTLWLGSNKGFYKVNRATSELQQIELNAGPEIISPLVFSIRGDQDGNLWMGTGAGLIRFNPLDYNYKIYSTGLADTNNRIDSRVVHVYIDEADIWVLTPYTIARFDKSNGLFDHTRFSDEPFNRYRETVFPCLYKDEAGNFWIGAHNGLHYFDPQTKKLTSFVNEPQNIQSLPFNDIRSILPDPYEPEKYIWLATGGGGLVRMNRQEASFKSYAKKAGLANNMVYGMLTDESGNLWLSTNQGLSRFNIREEVFYNYTMADGLQSNEFNSGAFFKSTTGEFFFGGIKGYNSFYPAQIQYNSYSPNIVVTGFDLLSSETSDSLTFNNIPGLNQIYLKHNQNHFTISFASLDVAQATKNSFAYSFSRKEENWIPLGHQRSITFTGLKPGTYTLKVKGTNNDGVWSDHTGLLKITIYKPWWERNVAIIIYLMLLISLAYGFRKYEISRLRLRNKMKLSELEARKLKDIDLMKSKFYANISHEFRTPLTLIKGPVEQMLDETSDNTKRKVLSMMHNNTEKMLNLINQLLDLSKLESGHYKIRVSHGGIVAFVKGFVMSFSSLAERNNIQLHFSAAKTLEDPLIEEAFYYDRDVIEKILTNLLSNAFKFTPQGGRVNVIVCLHTSKKHIKSFEITIKDSGIGIPKDKLPFIYDRFYQVDDSLNRAFEGTGIGLAFVKELVELHKGHIAAMSKPGVGTTFRLRFPIGKEYFTPEQITERESVTTEVPVAMGIPINGSAWKPLNDPPSHVSMPGAVTAGNPDNNGDTHLSGPELTNTDREEKPVVLIVEDHDDVRHYICDTLKGMYTIMEADNAFNGVEMASEHIPDLIISDVMMPDMDGYQCCNQIKSNDKTSHIPIILLTARAEDSDKIQGLENGADDYLTKPFNSKELRLRVKNIIESRRLLRSRFSDRTLIKPSELSVTSRDQAFMEKLIRIVEKNIGREQFSIEDFGNEVGMSQSQLNRKLKALINQSAVHFIRSRRMHRAKELLEKDAGNIADIAYMVGYNDPAYFTRTFKAFFGTPPSGLKKA